MRLFHDVPIRQKMLLIILSASGVAMLVAAAAVLIYEVTTFQPRVLQDLNAQAKLIRLTMHAPLSFDDQFAAAQNLATLNARAEISAAAVYANNGVLFAQYLRSPDADFAFPPVPDTKEHRFLGNHLLSFQPIVYENETLGYLFLQYNLPPLYARLPQYGIMFGVVMLALLAVALLLSSGLKRVITDPVLQLAGITTEISQHGDYDVRVTRNSGDEISLLYTGFNNMLEQIQIREAERDKAEKELTKSEEKYRTLVETADDVILLTDVEGKHIFRNSAYYTSLGFGKDECIDLDGFSRVHPDDVAILKDKLTELLNKGLATSEYRVRHKEGRWIHRSAKSVLIYGENNKPEAILSIIRDVTERKRSEEAIRNIAAGVSAQTGEAFFKSLVAHLVKLFDADYAFIGLLDEQTPKTVNTTALCIRGEIADNLSYELAGTPCEHVVGGACDVIRAYPRDIQRLFPEDQMLVEMGAQSYIGAPLVDTSGKPIGLIVMMDNKPMANTGEVENILEIFAARAAAEIERLRAERVLARSKAEFEAMFNAIPDAVMFADTERRIIMNNPAVHEMFGYSEQELIGSTTEMLYADRNDFLEQGRRYRVEPGAEQGPYEVRYKRKDGSVFWTETVGTQVKDANGNAIGFIGLFRDITGRKQAEAKIRAALAEKEVMLKEIHHRVKNNLQVISSLLNLQSRYIEDDATLALFMESRSRVRSMALIHEKLYRTKDFSHVDFSDYIRDLSAQLFRAHNVKPGKVHFNMELEDISLGIDIAVPCGLIINELLTNALKHAFPGGRKGTVRLQLHSKKPAKKKPEHGNPVVLTVSDDGVGMPAGFDISKNLSLGMQLVKTLSEQIDGALQISSGQGAHFAITFDANASEKPEV